MSSRNDFTSLEALNEKDINLNDYTFAQERFDERFGLIFYMKSKGSTKSLLVKERSKNLTPEQFQETATRLRITNDYLLKIHGVKQIPNSSTFQIYFEDFATDLQAEIRRHLAEKTRFSEGELYAIIYCAVSALACLEQNNISHDFIVPMNILKLSKDTYKLHDNSTLAAKNILYNHALRGQYQKYLAPELLDSLTNKREKPDAYDPHKADIFALGMCLLEAGLLDLESDYINRKLMILDEKLLNRALKKFGDLYSGAMRQILEDMLFPDPSQRPSATVLQKRLPGKPRLPGQPSSAKKRKVLDQVINSPDKSRRSDPLSSAKSPGRSEQSLGSPLPSTNNPQRLLLIEKSPPFEPNRFSSPSHDFTQSQPSFYQPEIHDFDPSSSFISPTIKNDPVLSKFISRVTNPTYKTVTSPTKYEFTSQPIQTAPRTYQYQSNIPVVSPTKVVAPSTYLSYQPEIRETEVRSTYVDPFAATHKVSYPTTTTTYAPHDLYADTYRTNFSYVSVPPQQLTKPKEDVPTYRSSYSSNIQTTYEAPKSTYPLATSSYSTLPKPYAEISKVDIKNYQSASYSSLPKAQPDVFVSQYASGSKPSSNIDDLINKALDRSQANLRSSQHQPSPGLTSSLTPGLSSSSVDIKSLSQPTAFKPNQTSSSLGYSATSPLDPILERQLSEDYNTPINSKVMDSSQGNLVDKVQKTSK